MRRVELAQNEGGNPTDHKPERDSTNHRHGKGGYGADQQERAARDCKHAGPICDESDRVVEERLALDQRDRHARHAQSSEDARGRDRVGGRHDRPQGERGGPAQGGIERLSNDRDRDHREEG